MSEMRAKADGYRQGWVQAGSKPRARPKPLTEAQKDAIPRLYKLGNTTLERLSAEYGVSIYRLSKITRDRRNPRKPGYHTPLPVACDLCQTPRALRPVLRFALQPRRVGNSPRRLTAGAIELCEPCWRRVALPRQRIRRLSTPRSGTQPVSRDHGTAVGVSADVAEPQSGAPKAVDASRLDPGSAHDGGLAPAVRDARFGAPLAGSTLLDQRPAGSAP